MEFLLPVSLGEALDKLTILEIKLSKIKEEDRLQSVKEESDALLNKLQEYKEKFSFWYQNLYDINLKIWNLQDNCRSLDLNTQAYLLKEILDENDRRFRVKRKINSISKLKEQKSYASKTVVICPHQGLGDQILILPAARYLSTIYDKVIVLCNFKHVKNIRTLVQDDPDIEIRETILSFFPDRLQIEKYFPEYQGFTFLKAGYYKNVELPKYDGRAPFCFYDDFGISRKIFEEYKYISLEGLSESFSEQKDLEKYIFIHEETAERKIDIVKLNNLDIDSTLVLCCNRNLYQEGHHFYEKAQKVLNLDMKSLIPYLVCAEKLILTDSAVFCLANMIHLNPEQKNICYIRGNCPYDLSKQFQYVSGHI